MHVRDEHVIAQQLDRAVDAGLRKELRCDVLRHEHGEHVALALELRILEERLAGGMLALDAAQDERRILLRIGAEVIGQLRRTDDQMDADGRKVLAQRPLHSQKRPLLHEHIRGKADRDLLAALAGGHALERQVPDERPRRTVQKTFPFFHRNPLRWAVPTPITEQLVLYSTLCARCTLLCAVSFPAGGLCPHPSPNSLYYTARSVLVVRSFCAVSFPAGGLCPLRIQYGSKTPSLPGGRPGIRFNSAFRESHPPESAPDRP